jgi:hypothetical protein
MGVKSWCTDSVLEKLIAAATVSSGLFKVHMKEVFCEIILRLSQVIRKIR